MATSKCNAAGYLCRCLTVCRAGRQRHNNQYSCCRMVYLSSQSFLYLPNYHSSSCAVTVTAHTSQRSEGQNTCIWQFFCSSVAGNLVNNPRLFVSLPWISLLFLTHSGGVNVGYLYLSCKDIDNWVSSECM